MLVDVKGMSSSLLVFPCTPLSFGSLLRVQLMYEFILYTMFQQDILHTIYENSFVNL